MPANTKQTKAICRNANSGTLRRDPAILRNARLKAARQKAIAGKKKQTAAELIDDILKEYVRSNPDLRDKNDVGLVFKHYVCDLLKNDDYEIIKGDTDWLGDHGVDMIVSQTKESDYDLENPITTTYAVACKYKSKDNVTYEEYRRVESGNLLYHKCDRIMFFTTNDYSNDAQVSARRTKITKLITGKELVKMTERLKKQP
ncbi:MAG: restriction endonuclease [Candidatus Methanomethylophilaceae archaeon]